MSQTSRSRLRSREYFDSTCGNNHLYAYYRKVMTSAGMVQFILGLAYVITWTFVESLLYEFELAMGIGLIISGIIGMVCGETAWRFMVYATMVVSALAGLASLTCMFLIFSVISSKGSSILTNPIMGTFLIYSILGLIFTILSVTYGFRASRAISKFVRNEKGSKDCSSAGRGAASETKITTATPLYRDMGLPKEERNVNTNSSIHFGNVSMATIV